MTVGVAIDGTRRLGPGLQRPGRPVLPDRLAALVREGPVTLPCRAGEEERSQAAVLRSGLQGRLAAGS